MWPSQLLFEFLIIAFDAPAQFGGTDELMERDVRRKRCSQAFTFEADAMGVVNDPVQDGVDQLLNNPESLVVNMRLPPAPRRLAGRMWSCCDLVV